MTATTKSRKLADQADRQTESLSVVKLSNLRRQALRMQAGVAHAFREQIPFQPAVIGYADQLAEAIVDVMVGAHLLGRLNVIDQAATAKRRIAREKKALDRIDEVVGFVRERLDVTPMQLEQLRQTYSSAALDVARGFSETVNNRVRIEIAQSLASGEHVREGVKRLNVAFNSMGITGLQPHLLETMFRTQTRLAWSAGEANADQDPAIDEILWGYEYVTVGDDRVRPSHQGLEGTRLPKNDPVWDSIRPPNGFNCRCQLVRIFVDEVEPEVSPQVVEVDGELVVPGPDPGFDFNPGRLHRDVIQVKAPSIAASVTVSRPKLPGEVLALAALIDDAGRTDQEIADIAGCSRRSLYNWPKFRAARAAARSGRTGSIKGAKFGGKVEAWS